MTRETSLPPDTSVFDCALIIGCGLIGGSIGHGLIRHRVSSQVVGYDANTAHAHIALQRGLIEATVTSLDTALANADLIVLAVPVGRTEQLVVELGRSARPEAVIVDTGSVKQAFTQQCAQLLPANLKSRVVPCHPIAGHVQAGPEHADAGLMEGRPMIMTPEQEVDTEVLRRVARMWRKIGFNTLTMSAQEHDAMYADLSHMPHVLAFTLMHHIHDRGMCPDTLNAFAGNAFRDMTHHAGRNSRMWRDIFYANRAEISRSLADFRRSLVEIENLINSEDQERLEQMLAQLQQARMRTW